MAQDLRTVVRSFDRVQEEEQAAAFARQKGLPYVNLVNYPFVGDVLGLVPETAARQYRIVAFMKTGSTVRVASPDPFAAGLSEQMTRLGQTLGLSFEPFICSTASLDYALGRYSLLVPQATKKPAPSNPAEQIQTLEDLQAILGRVSTSELLEAILGGAVALNASDVHFEPMTDGIHVRFRVDGKLLAIINLPEKNYLPLAARIKTAAKIKLDLKAVAQDGRMSVTVGSQPIDIRVNVLPSAYGQTIELRLLNYKQFMSLEQLGLNDQIKAAVLDAVKRPDGLILFAGPTGSGKTTSLYAVLQLLNSPEKKIITIEDPIEYRLDGIEQVQVDPAAGFDFPEALRAVLRQDPDTIMVGEIRDKETAEIAVNAALTGHLVLSTLHTNSAAAAFSRLLQMGVPKYLIADAITLVVAQRLVRQLCPNCHGQGCEQCYRTGFKGRLLIAEFYRPDAQTVELIRREATLGEFEQQYVALGYQTMLQDGLNKVAQGLTTEAEVRSVAA